MLESVRLPRVASPSLADGRSGPLSDRRTLGSDPHPLTGSVPGPGEVGSGPAEGGWRSHSRIRAVWFCSRIS
ncbi:hypothetical protein ACFFX0_06230 [Citricoccus parietis]|uniref:Uncharacterized protein n=1 Tax=Citricoccus parietis TaxID=592307 RepID=A0ABV5FX18_9MICC